MFTVHLYSLSTRFSLEIYQYRFFCEIMKERLYRNDHESHVMTNCDSYVTDSRNLLKRSTSQCMPSDWPHLEFSKHIFPRGAVPFARSSDSVATLRAHEPLPRRSPAADTLFPQRNLSLPFLWAMSYRQALRVKAWIAVRCLVGTVGYMKKYIDTCREGVHNLLRSSSNDHPHPLKIYAPACTTRLVSRLLDKLRSVLPRSPTRPR
jgi:hypothetical protein